MPSNKLTEKQKMMLFINQPILLTNHMRRVQQKEFFNLKTIRSIFSQIPNVERFRNLQQARTRVTQDKYIDQKILRLVGKLHSIVKECQQKNKQLEIKKHEIISRFEMDDLKNQLESSIQKLDKIIQQYVKIKRTMDKDRQDILKMVKMTEIKKALEMQNKILKEQNAALRTEQAALYKQSR